MTSTTPAAPERDDENTPVDLDLDADDALLREAIGKPTTVRTGGKVITFAHSKEWPHEASQFMNQGAFYAWGVRVLPEEDYEVFKTAGLRNYQIEKIIETCQRNSGLPAGKASQSSRSSGSTRKR